MYKIVQDVAKADLRRGEISVAVNNCSRKEENFQTKDVSLLVKQREKEHIKPK